MPVHVPRPRRRLLAVGSAVVVLTIATVASAAAEPAAAAAGAISRVDLVADVAGVARTTDPNLVNPWGLSASPTGPLWVSNAGTDTSTVYSGATKGGQGATVVPLVVAIPGGGIPTGQVFNSSSGFVLPNGSKAVFIFAGVTGDISAWNGGTTAVLVAPSTGGSYTGLALDSTTSPTLLAADFHNARVDVFDSAFHKLNRPTAFPATGVPSGYAPFNVAALGNRVYVSYAKQDAAHQRDVPGAGHGYVNVFTKAGGFVKTLVAQDDLNSPWGMAIAPAGFGTVAGDLLVGNFGDGRIHAYTASGALADTLHTGAGRTIVIPGLWGLLPGNGVAGRTSDVWFSSGPGHEAHGLLGVLRPAG